MIPGLSYNMLLHDNKLMRDLLREWLLYREHEDFSVIPELTAKFLNESKEYLKESEDVLY